MSNFEIWITVITDTTATWDENAQWEFTDPPNLSEVHHLVSTNYEGTSFLLLNWAAATRWPQYERHIPQTCSEIRCTSRRFFSGIIVILLLSTNGPLYRYDTNSDFPTHQTVVLPLVAIWCAIAFFWLLRSASSHPIRAIVVPALIISFLTSALNNLGLIVEDMIATSAPPLDPIHINRAANLKHRFRVADLHCDTLLWASRNPLISESYPFNSNRTVGHVDLPRLLAGNIGIQVFAVSLLQQSCFDFQISASVGLEQQHVKVTYLPHLFHCV